MENQNNATNETNADLAAEIAARKAKMESIKRNSKTAGKAIGLMALGSALTIAVTKFRNRNNDGHTEATAQ